MLNDDLLIKKVNADYYLKKKQFWYKTNSWNNCYHINQLLVSLILELQFSDSVLLEMSARVANRKARPEDLRNSGDSSHYSSMTFDTGPNSLWKEKIGEIS